MAIASVKEMVNERLPFTTPNSYDTPIEKIRVQMTYIMQNQTLKTDIDVETEINYRPLENILFSLMVCYQFIKIKALQTMAGDGVNPGTAAKTLKRAKADVTEAEFTVVKAADGALIQVPTVDLMKDLLVEICSTAQILKYNCPWCQLALDEIPAFIIGEDYPGPPPSAGFNNLLNGQPIGL